MAAAPDLTEREPVPGLITSVTARPARVGEGVATLAGVQEETGLSSDLLLSNAEMRKKCIILHELVWITADSVCCSAAASAFAAANFMSDD